MPSVGMEIFMILKRPDYCRHFRCTADKCTDSCCIGWEIDIDPEKAAYYLQLDGEIGERLKASIAEGETCSFILDEKERCPFLNEQGLCDLILTLGEESLCEICTEHPRFYNWFGGFKEGGIGMCCEEAARLILTDPEPFTVVSEEITEKPDAACDEALYEILDKARMTIIRHLECTEIPLMQRLADVLSYGMELEYALAEEKPIPTTIGQDSRLPDFPMDSIFEMLEQLEAMGENWHPFVKHCHSMEPDAVLSHIGLNDESNRYLQNIVIYFVWRYMMQSIDDGDLMGHLGFAAGSTAVIRYLFACHLTEHGALTQADCIRIAVNYAKEIEYAEENRMAMEDVFYACLG